MTIKTYIFKLLLFSAFLAFSTISGQPTDYPKYHFETLQQLPTQRAVASMSQDKEGFLWMGTNGLGLFQFNGLDYKSYQYSENDPANLSNSLIYTTFIDLSNKLWVGTAKGLDRYDRDKDKFITIQLFENMANHSVSVHTIFQIDEKFILVGTHEYGLFKVHTETFVSEAVKIEGVEEIRNLLINSITVFDTKTLIGTDMGLFEYDTDQVKVSPLTFTTNKGEDSVDDHIKTMTVDSQGTIWLGTTSNGLVKIDRNENGRYNLEKLEITSKRILSLLYTPRNTLLCGTENDGLFELDKSGKIVNHYLNSKYSNNSIKSNSIWEIFQDNQKRIWISYYNNGVGVYDEFYDKFKDIRSEPNDSNSLQSSSVTSILKDDQNRLWIGMDGGGVDVYEPSTNTFTHLLNNNNSTANGLNSPDVQTIYRDTNGNIWIGTWDYGIYFLKKGATTFINYSVESTAGEMETNRVLSFSEDSKGTIWIGTFSRGIHSFDPKTKTFKAYDEDPFFDKRISYSDVRSVYVDSEDHVWIGGNEGLFKLRIHDGKYEIKEMSSRFYNNKNHSYTSLVLDIYEDSSKNIWIGTDGAGLCRYNMITDTFHWMDSESDFNKVTVSTIIEDNKGCIWAAGNNGLSVIDKTTNVVNNFTVNDGLLSNDFNNHAAYKDKNGSLYFGSYEGINFFDPENLPVYETKPKVYLTGFRVFNQLVSPAQEDSPLEKVISQTKHITLKHNQSVFTIDFASVDFTRPEKIEFAYYLEGFEEDWNYVNTARSATYTNLPAGNYTFKVKASNSDGLWNETYKSLSLEILNPWWLTSFAISSYILVSFVLFVLTIRFIDKRIQTKRAIAQERERHRQEEFLNDKKIQFFTNISHEFRTPLTLIMSPLNDILKESSGSKKFKDKLKIIHRNTLRLNRLIDELMDFRKLQFSEMPLNLSFFEINKFLKQIIEHFEEEAHQRNIALSLEIDESITKVWADKSKLEKIIFNILSNAFKSTSNNGIIRIKADRKEGYHFDGLDSDTATSALEISVEDTGKGIAKDELGKIFKRFYQIKDRNEQYYNGTGIGLEVVRSFVDLHKGDIQVESEVGLGTKFIILIPLEEEHYNFIPNEEKTKSPIDKKPKIQKMDSLAKLTRPDNSRNTVLVIEDNLELRTYLSQELRNDYKVLVAEDGKEGLEMAINHMPDSVITDVIMPKMNGYEFCKQLKNNLKTSHIPVLMLTAKAMTEDWVDGLEAGADVYLNKPFEMRVMRSQVKQLIHNRRLLYSKYVNTVIDENIQSEASSLDQQFLLNLINYIKTNLKDPNLNVETLASEFNLSRSQLYRKNKLLTGLSVNELIRKIRLQRAKDLIEEQEDMRISEISYNVGFSSPSYFSKCFKEIYGVSPKELNSE